MVKTDIKDTKETMENASVLKQWLKKGIIFKLKIKKKKKK